MSRNKLLLGTVVTIVGMLCGCVALPALQEVRFQSKAGKVLNFGKLSDTGGILCFCKNCNGKASHGARWGSPEMVALAAGVLVACWLAV